MSNSPSREDSTYSSRAQSPLPPINNNEGFYNKVLSHGRLVTHYGLPITAALAAAYALGAHRVLHPVGNALSGLYRADANHSVNTTRAKTPAPTPSPTPVHHKSAGKSNN